MLRIKDDNGNVLFQLKDEDTCPTQLRDVAVVAKTEEELKKEQEEALKTKENKDAVDATDAGQPKA